MTELSTHTVYALKSYKKTIDTPQTLEDFQHDGYLLFITQHKAESFLEMCEQLNSRKLCTRYEKYDHVSVSPFIYEKVQKNNSFYVNNLKN